MNRLRYSLLAALGLSVLATSAARSAPVRGQRSGLEQVPAKSLFVLHLRGVQGTRDRFVAMMQNALPEVLKKIQPQMDDLLKNGYEGRKLRGLVEDGPIFLAMLELPIRVGQPGNHPPKFAIIAAVRNYKEFRDNLLKEEERKNIKVNGSGVESVNIENETTPTYFVDRKTFVVVTPNEEVANAFTKKQPGLDGKLSKEQAAKFLAGDVGYYVNMESLNKQYAEQFKEARKGIEQGIDLFTQQGDATSKQAFDLIKKAIGPVFQAIEDTQGVVLTVEFRPSGLALHLEGEVSEGSTTAALLQDSKPMAFKELDRLPAGRAYYSAMKISTALYKGLGGLIFGVAANPDSKEIKAVTAALDELAKAGPTLRLDAFSFPMTGLQVYHYQEPAKAVDATQKLLKAMGPGGTISAGALKEKPTVELNAKKHGDFALHSVQLVWDLDKMAEQVGAKAGEEAKKKYIALMKGILGEKATMWFGTDGKSVVQIVAADWPTARKLLDEYGNGDKTIGGTKAFRAIRKEMPARASLLGLFDVVQMGATAVGLIKPLLGNNVPLPNKPAKGTSAFVGLSVTLQPRRGGLDLFLSADAARAIYNGYVKPFVGE